MNESNTERPVSRTSTAAREGGIKRQTLVEVGTCVCCGQRKAEFTTHIGYGHRREPVEICGQCIRKVPLERIAAKVFRRRETELHGRAMHIDVIDVVGREEVGA